MSPTIHSNTTITRGCKPNWDIGILVIFPGIGILPLSNWDIGIFIAKFGILGYCSNVHFWSNIARESHSWLDIQKIWPRSARHHSVNLPIQISLYASSIIYAQCDSFHLSTFLIVWMSVRVQLWSILDIILLHRQRQWLSEWRGMLMFPCHVDVNLLKKVVCRSTCKLFKHRPTYLTYNIFLAISLSASQEQDSV